MNLRTLSFIYLLLVSLELPATAQQVQPDSTSTSSRMVYSIVQQHPEFTGGMRKLADYISNNLRYPKSAQMGRIEGRVFINFIVSETGAIEEVRALNHIDPELDAEAIRLVRNMPNWRPARQDGKAVACRYNLPIHFSLANGQ